LFKDFTFSNGVTLPAGTLIAAPIAALHYNEKNYSNPHQFDGFRFSKIHEQPLSTGKKYFSVTTSIDYLAFGHGEHAW
jgi:cytochrome P450